MRDFPCGYFSYSIRLLQYNSLTYQLLLEIHQSYLIDAEWQMRRDRYASIDETSLHTHVMHMHHPPHHIIELQSVITRGKSVQQNRQVHRLTRTHRGRENSETGANGT